MYDLHESINQSFVTYLCNSSSKFLHHNGSGLTHTGNGAYAFEVYEEVITMLALGPKGVGILVRSGVTHGTDRGHPNPFFKGYIYQPPKKNERV